MAAVTGTFNADFQPFADAVAEAKVTLKTFEDGASTAQGKLTTLANSFSGVKIIQQAELMAEAKPSPTPPAAPRNKPTPSASRVLTSSAPWSRPRPSLARLKAPGDC